MRMLYSVQLILLSFFLVCSSLVQVDSVCSIPRLSHYSKAVFQSRFQGRSPVVFPAPHDSANARASMDESTLRREFGHLPVTLASANANSYAKLESTLNEYLDGHLFEVPLDAKADELWYLFGDTLASPPWAPLHATFQTVREVQDDPIIVWGAGGLYSGVPFHRHGPVFAEVLIGSKRWYLSPPDSRPSFSGNETTLSWMVNRGGGAAGGVLGCTLLPSEILYIPNDWWHATLNLDPYTAFLSTFTRESGSTHGSVADL